MESLAAVKASFSEVIDRVQKHHERVVVTRRRREAAVIVSLEDIRSLEETIAVLSDPATMRRLQEADAAIAAGDVVDAEGLRALLASARDKAWQAYELRVAGPAARAIAERLPEAIAAAVVEFITGPLLDNPHRVGTEVSGPLTGTHAARRGTYRVLHVIDDDQRLVTVKDVDHRADAYRRR